MPPRYAGDQDTAFGTCYASAYSCRRTDRWKETGAMQFGLFGSAAARRGGPEFDSSEGFRDFIEYNIEAEALGFHSTFVVEHHFTGYGQVSATLNLLTWLGARTGSLLLGTAASARYAALRSKAITCSSANTPRPRTSAGRSPCTGTRSKQADAASIRCRSGSPGHFLLPITGLRRKPRWNGAYKTACAS